MDATTQRSGTPLRHWAAVAAVLTVVAAAGCSGDAPAEATEHVGTSVSRVELYGSLGELAADSAAVVTGTVQGQRAAVDIEGSTAEFALSDVVVEEALRGDAAPGDVVVVRQLPGGSSDPTLLRQGSSYLLFLVTSELDGDLASQYYVTGATAGVYEATGSGDSYERLDPSSGDDLPARATTADARG